MQLNLSKCHLDLFSSGIYFFVKSQKKLRMIISHNFVD